VGRRGSIDFPSPEGLALGGRGFPRERFLSLFLSRKRGGELPGIFPLVRKMTAGYLFAGFYFPGKTHDFLNKLDLCIAETAGKSAL